MRISIIQSCYIPWRGFFDLIGRCDEYVVFDSAQYVKRHWHNRNRIKTANGPEWLTIPVVTKGRFDQRIDEVEIEKTSSGRNWADKHWRSMELAYARAPHFAATSPIIRGWYEQAERERLLTDVNLIFLRGLSDMLGLSTRIVRDDAYPAEGAKTQRLLSICRAAGADRYLSGPSAKEYFDEPLFRTAGVTPEWMTYDGYAAYPQLHGGYEPAVSVLDLIFNTGTDAARALMRSADASVK